LDFKTVKHKIIQILFYCSCNNPKFKLHCVTLVKGEVVTPLFTYTEPTYISVNVDETNDQSKTSKQITLIKSPIILSVLFNRELIKPNNIQ